MELTNSASKIKIIQDADTCVRCGLCLPHCPTYGLTRNESESPRGRIAIAKAYAEGKIPLSENLFKHLDHCLSCQSCEAMCPANVPYSELMNETRALLQQEKKRRIPLLLRTLVDKPRCAWLLSRLAWFYQRCGIQWLLRKTRLIKLFGLHRYDAFLPAITPTPSLRSYYPANTPEKGDVALFLGCISRFCDGETLRQTIQLLNTLGFGVRIPERQACCGAMDLHQGNKARTQKLCQRNQKAFAAKDISAIISIASGCGAALKDTLLKPVFDICDFILQQHLPLTWLTGSTERTILVHTPCTLRNSLRKKDSVKMLLEKMNFKNIALLDTNTCCGAAGLHMWHYPETAAQLAEPILQEILKKQPDIFLTSNIGCLLHLQKILRGKGQKTRLMHPVTLVFQEKLLYPLEKP